MHVARSLLFTGVSVALALGIGSTRDAAACGGFFQPPAENTTVGSHRMILSVSQAQSTLYDQIRYTGAPSSFAWVLPIKGTVAVDLSSDALFDEIDQLTAVTVTAPAAPPPSCECPSASAGGTTTGAGSSSSSGGVMIISQTVVGPYATAQLSSSDPTALTTWLSTNGYAIPSDVATILGAYVTEGFDFLAMKLVPGATVQSMRPVRVTTPGASPVLPLRMVAAGAGVTLPITLFVLGEGRYAPTNFPTFTIDPTALVWDFATETSNYAALRAAGFAMTNNTWLVESALPIAEQSITSVIDNLVQNDPLMSGYADSMGNGAPMSAMNDLTTLFAGIAPTSFFITRLLAQMPRTALTADLTLGASTSQATVPNALSATTYINPPPCPCSQTSGSSGTSGPGAGGSTASTTGSTAGAGGAAAKAASNPQTASGCAITASDAAPLAVFGVVAAVAAAASRRRRRR